MNYFYIVIKCYINVTIPLSFNNGKYIVTPNYINDIGYYDIFFIFTIIMA